MNQPVQNHPGMGRRKFLQLSALAAGAVGGAAPPAQAAATSPREPGSRRRKPARKYNGPYSGAQLNHIAFPLGGMGAGMICLEGTGALSHFSIRNRPEVFHEPETFAALYVKGLTGGARVLEGPVPDRKKFGAPGTGNGAEGSSFGLPRFREATFRARFPFATVELSDPAVPLEIELTGWSPFEPGNADDSSMPAAALEYRFTNRTGQEQEAVFSWNARNFMRVGENPHAVKTISGGFVLWSAAPKDRGWEEGSFAASVDDPAVKVNPVWFRGGWFDALTMAWNDISRGNCPEQDVAQGQPSPGGSLFVPFKLAPHASKTIVLRFAWYVGQTNLHFGRDPEGAAKAPGYKPWYAERAPDPEPSGRRAAAHESPKYRPANAATPGRTDGPQEHQEMT